MKNGQLKYFSIFPLLCLLLNTTSLSSQSWERLYWGGEINNQAEADKVFVEADGSYLLSGYILGGKKFMQTDENGYLANISPVSYIGAILKKTTDGNFLSASNGHLQKIDANGNNLWENDFPYSFSDGIEFLSDIIESADGNYIISGIRQYYVDLSESEYFAYIAKVDENGTVLWKTVGSFEGILNYTLVATADGGYLLTGSSDYISITNPLLTILMKFDQNGQLLWEKPMDTPIQVRNAVLTQDGGFVMIGKNGLDNNFSLLKIDSDGNDVWETVFSDTDYGLTAAYSLILTADNGFAFLGSKITPDGDVLLFKTDVSGNLMWQQSYGGPFTDYMADLKQTLDGGYIMAGFGNRQLEDESLYIIKTDAQGFSLPNIIHGFVKYDLNENCFTDDNEEALENWIVSATAAWGTFYGAVDENGYYSIEVDTGNYVVSLTQANAFWSSCNNDVSMQISDTVTLDFPTRTDGLCPLLNVAVESLPFILCTERNLTVTYSNLGSLQAEDVYVEINFDDSLQVLAASVPFSLVSDNLYTFDIGAVDYLSTNTFSLTVQIGCDIELMGQTLCMEAHIYPDTTCLPLDPLWSGANIDLAVVCEDDEVIFTIENTGTEDMPNSLQYIVIQDDVIMLEGGASYGPLTVGESKIISRPANGSFYRMESPQIAYHPSLSNTKSIFIEGCGLNEEGEINTSFVNQYSLNDDDYFIDIFCKEVLASYDPNAKEAFPKGYDEAHFIEQNTRIDYVIYFQNTGTATANEVLIMDPLSSQLKPATIRPSTSSHPYDFELLPNGVATFTFNDIMLPDSNANEAASHGFVKFSIEQKENLTESTIINNTAAIYFDANPPIFTNTTLHTIGEHFITVDVGDILKTNVSINVFPNPFMESATISVEGIDTRTLNISIFDINGKEISTDQFNEKYYQIQRKGLNAGVYFYKIWGEGILINTGKLLIQ